MQLGVDLPAGFLLSGVSTWAFQVTDSPRRARKTSKPLPFILSNINPTVMKMVLCLLGNAVHTQDQRVNRASKQLLIDFVEFSETYDFL